MSQIIDFHTHILPNVDDGSHSVETSIEMLRMEEKQGVGRVILTPHFYANHDSPQRFFKRCQKSLVNLRDSMANYSDIPKLSFGAEVHFFEGMSDSESLLDMAITGTRCILVEMPMSPWSDRMLQELTGIHQKYRLIPIIAHIDRYISPFRNRGIMDSLAKLPVLIQANASFFTQKSTQRLALKLLREEKIHLLGSDCHNLESRPPNIDGAIKVIEKHLGSDAVMRINYQGDKLFNK